MIEEALKEELLAEFNSIPSLEELQKMYSFSERHVRRMEEIFAELRKREQKEQHWHMVRKVAIIVIAVLAAVFASVKFVPEVYAYVKEWLMEFADDESIEFRGSSRGKDAETGEVLRFELGYVPEGYELEREVEYEIGVCEKYYKDKDGIYLIMVCMGKSASDLLALNIEGVTVEETTIDGVKYHIFVDKEAWTVIAWECGGYIIKVEGMLDKSHMLEMAISVKVTEIGK